MTTERDYGSSYISRHFEPGLTRLLLEAQWAKFFDSLSMQPEHRPFTKKVAGALIEPSFLVDPCDKDQAFRRNGPIPQSDSGAYWIDVSPFGQNLGYHHLLSAQLIAHDVPRHLAHQYFVVFGGPAGVDDPDTSTIQTFKLWPTTYVDGFDMLPDKCYFGECTYCQNVSLLLDWEGEAHNGGLPHGGCQGRYICGGRRVQKAMSESLWDEQQVIEMFRHLST